MSKTPIAFAAITPRPRGKSLTPPKPANDPAPTPTPTPDPGKSLAEQRIDLVLVLAALQGRDALASDVLQSLAQDGLDPAATPLPPATMLAAIRAAGLVARQSKTPDITQAELPALAQMTSGQYVLVLSQSPGALTIYDASAPDHRTTVLRAEFAPVFAGTLLTGRADPAALNAAHAGTGPAAHWFWGQFPRFRRQIAEITLGSLVANLLAVSVALFSLQVYDRVIPHQSESTLWVLAIGAIMALSLETLIKIARGRLTDGAGRKIEMTTQRLLMDRLMGMRSDLRDTPPSTLFNAMREFGSVREFFTASTIGTLADLPFILLFLALVASIAGNVVWVLVAGGILMVVPGLLMQRRMMRLTEETMGAQTRAGRLLHEAIFEADTVKTQRAEDRIARVWAELNAVASLKSTQQRRIASTLTFWSQGVQQGTYVAAVIMGTYLVFAGEFTVGSIIAVGILTSRTLAPLTQLAGTMARWSNVKTALDALDRIATAEQDSDPARSYLRRESIDGQFELRGVQFRYDDDGAPVLDIPGVLIQPGQSVAVLGANGSGKSTLLKLLSGLYAPTSGRVLIDGVDMGQIAPGDLRRTIGYLGQDVRLFAGTLRDNLNLTMLERDDERLMQALDFAGLGPFVKGHHKGLDLEIRDGGTGLSVGQRQSIGWARLWLQGPRVVLLDEPTAAMDQTLEATMVSRLETWLSGRTAVIATHRVPILSLTDRTLILQNGRMAVDGPRDAVLAHLQQNASGGASA